MATLHGTWRTLSVALFFFFFFDATALGSTGTYTSALHAICNKRPNKMEAALGIAVPLSASATNRTTSRGNKKQSRITVPLRRASGGTPRHARHTPPLPSQSSRSHLRFYLRCVPFPDVSRLEQTPWLAISILVSSSLSPCHLAQFPPHATSHPPCPRSVCAVGACRPSPPPPPGAPARTRDPYCMACHMFFHTCNRFAQLPPAFPHTRTDVHSRTQTAISCPAGRNFRKRLCLCRLLPAYHLNTPYYHTP